MMKSCEVGAVHQRYQSGLYTNEVGAVRHNDDGTKVYVAVHVDDFDIAASNTALKLEAMAAIQEVYNCVE